jgi:hypothetical protein
MENNRILSRNPDLLETTLDSEVVLMSIERGSYYGMEKTAARIWQLLAQPKTRGELLQALVQQYDAPQEIIAKDMDIFLQQMHDHGIVNFS